MQFPRICCIHGKRANRVKYPGACVSGTITRHQKTITNFGMGFQDYSYFASL